MPNFGGGEILLILLVLLLLFGAKRLPDTARGLGRSLRIFKAETRGLRDDDNRADSRADSRADTRAEPRALEDGVPEGRHTPPVVDRKTVVERETRDS